MVLSWNEIKDRAIRFSKERENETCEGARAKYFWDVFFNVFGINQSTKNFFSSYMINILQGCLQRKRKNEQ